MNLHIYIDDIHRQLEAAAEAGGDEARALADRLLLSLDAAIRLALQDALAAAAEEITCELAPGSVELRLRGRDLEFVVTPPPGEASVDVSAGDHDEGPRGGTGATMSVPASAPGEADEGGMSRTNLRMPDHLKARIEQAAGSDGLSVNAWLVRAAGAALERGDLDRHREPRAPRTSQRYTGWAR
jgi:hypothetical protein